MAANVNKKNKGMGIHARRALAYIVLVIISFFCLFWFYVMIINATRSNGELQAGFTAIPSTHLLDNWNSLLHDTLPVIRGMFNSLFVAACSAVLCVYFSTMTAYAIHAYEFKAKKFISTFILMVMMIPTQVTALGFVKLVTGMGLMDSFIPLIVPTIASPVTYFYMKQYMESSLPLSLIEAARIDGMSEYRIWYRVMLPLAKPALSTLTIFTFVNTWNDFLGPLIYLTTESKKTLQLGLRMFISQFGSEYGLIMAASVLSLIPVLIVFLSLQKYFVEGVAASGVKG